MMKFLIAVLIIIGLGTVAICCAINTYDEKEIASDNNYDERWHEVHPDVDGFIGFYTHRRYTVDTSSLRESLGVLCKSQFVFFMQVTRLDNIRSMGELAQRDFEFPDIDFELDDYREKYFAVSFGREVVEMEAIGLHPHRGEMLAAITFAEEYNEDVMFLYIMDKISLRLRSGSEFYYLEGSERVFKGTSDLDLFEWDRSWDRSTEAQDATH